MADVAAAQILHSAAPGQFDDIVQQLGRMGASFGNLDTLKHEWQLSQGIGANASVSNPLAADLKEKLLRYQQKAFSGAGGRGSIVKKANARVWVLPGDSPSQFQVVSFAEKIDGNNLQTGYWKSTWTITSTSGAEAEVKGTVELHTYSFEEGNTQMQLVHSFDGEIVEEMENEMVEEEPSLANGVLFKIIQWEHEVLSILKGLHDLSGDSLKKIRRVLPITKTKMNWEVEAQRGVRHLKQTAKR